MGFRKYFPIKNFQLFCLKTRQFVEKTHVTQFVFKKHLWQLCIKWINQICLLKYIYENKKFKNSFYIFGCLLELSIESDKLLFIFWQLGNPKKHMFCCFEKTIGQMAKTHHRKNHWNDELLRLNTIELGCALYSIILFHTFVVATQLELGPSFIVLAVSFPHWCFTLHQISLVGFNYILFVSLETHFNCSQAL